jgi:uroporphyrinogen III methyltransferase/synthase
VDVVALYETVAEPLDAEQLEALRSASYVTFTSASTVRHFLAGGGSVPDGARAASIGPITSAALREHGIEPSVEAERNDIPGLVDALVADAAARRVAA